MKFTHRLAYYLFGIMLGTAIVVFMFKDRTLDWCYLPNCRVLQDIRGKKLVVSDEAKKTLDEAWVSMDDITFLTENGDVDFSRSNKPYGDGKLYVIDSQNAKGEPIEATIVNYREKALLKGIKKL